MAAGLSPQQAERYARHLSLSEVSPRGQQRLLQARVLVVGVGALGSPAALYLAAAGVGTLGLADHDLVRLSNLQRQVVHRTASVGMSKVEAAATQLAELNPEVRVLQEIVELVAGERGDGLHEPGVGFLNDVQERQRGDLLRVPLGDGQGEPEATAAEAPRGRPAWSATRRRSGSSGPCPA